MQNMKVDIVYYTVPADFEMEFNLNGCCPMRLLKTLTNNKKEFIESLARAVSRSKVIIICGPVYGEDGLINLTAKAIRKPLEIVNNSEYGIAQDQNVRIIKDSVPLVTKSGMFAGVIIESGPQTIIVLCENKDIRRSVMRDLIHPYVQEVSILEIRRSSGASGLNITPSESATDSAAEHEPAEEPDNNGTPENTEASVEENKAETAGVPSDEALKAVADEINDLSGKLGQTLYANDNTENNESGAQDANALPATDISDDDFYFENETEESEYEIERTESFYGEAAQSGGETFETAPQIDFNLDTTDDEPDDQTEPLPNNYGKVPDKKAGVDVPTFLFDDPEEEESADESSELSDSSDISYIPDNYDDSDNADKKQHKPFKISIIIITAALAVIAVLLVYFLVYRPNQNGISAGEYISRLFSGKVTAHNLILRG